MSRQNAATILADSTDRNAPFDRNPGGRILVADDNGAMREMVVQSLLDDGYEVYEAADGDELLWIVQSIKVNSWPVEIFDVLVMDIMMPRLSGLEALRRLRVMRCETPVVLMTAFPDAQTKAEAARFRAPLLRKPFPMGELGDAVLTTLISRPPQASRLHEAS